MKISKHAVVVVASVLVIVMGAAVAGCTVSGKTGEVEGTSVANPCAAENPCAPMNPCASANPCGAANPCNPCAPMNPCAAKNVCSPNPCAQSNPCAANPCNPCAQTNPCAANPCNPCAPMNPCAQKNICTPNPCAQSNPCAANPCNPCAANPCNPCAQTNPCAANPCAPAAEGELTDAEATAAYQTIEDELQAGYAKSGHPVATAYINWKRYNKTPYLSETHGSRFVNNFANRIAAAYGGFETAGVMPQGSVLAKNSFAVTTEGTAQPGPLFLMEKMPAGFSPEIGDWRYTMIMPDGSVFGATKGAGAAKVQFCANCHNTVGEEQDSLFFLPEAHRVSY